jgi:hypothetical protein
MGLYAYHHSIAAHPLVNTFSRQRRTFGGVTRVVSAGSGEFVLPRTSVAIMSTAFAWRQERQLRRVLDCSVKCAVIPFCLSSKTIPRLDKPEMYAHSQGTMDSPHVQTIARDAAVPFYTVNREFRGTL